ncbi:hypothetical protein ES703_112014 [subsurface metagenome]
MTDQIVKEPEEPEVPEEPEAVKKPEVFTVCNCKVTVVETADGKKHFEATCLSKEARDKLASVFEQEAILRVNPKVKIE